MGMLKNVARSVPGLVTALVVGSVAQMAHSDCDVPVEWRMNRPDPEGTATPVSIGVFLIDLQSIDDSNQSFEADIFLATSWRDSRMVSSEPGGSLAGCRLDLDEVWSPRIIFVNERSVRRLFDEQVTVADDGSVEYVQRLQGEFTTPLDLRDFPFDDQELWLEVVSRGYTPEEVAFVPEPNTGSLNHLTITDWEIGKGYSVVEPRYVEPRDRFVASVSFRAPVERRVGFYLMKTFLPLTLIVCMSWAVFWIKPGQLPPQIGVSTSAVLTLIAFQFSLGYMLPRLSYLTRADRFLIGSTLLVFLAFGEAVWTSYLATSGQEEQALKIDRVSRIAFPLGFSLVVIVSVVI